MWWSVLLLPDRLLLLRWRSENVSGALEQSRILRKTENVLQGLLNNLCRRSSGSSRMKGSSTARAQSIAPLPTLFQAPLMEPFPATSWGRKGHTAADGDSCLQTQRTNILVRIVSHYSHNNNNKSKLLLIKIVNNVYITML